MQAGWDSRGRGAWLDYRQWSGKAAVDGVKVGFCHPTGLGITIFIGGNMLHWIKKL